MSSDQVPYRSEVLGWSPQQLADFMKRMNLSGCDKAVLKHSISGSRFVNLSDNDLQKFPKPYSPMIWKLSSEISKKEEKRGLFAKKTTPRYHESDTVDAQGWGEDEFDDDDDYEKPNSSDEDYESPTDDLDGDYEPPPSEPPEDLAHSLCPSLPIGDGDYIDKRDNNVSSRGVPPVVCPRPPVSTLTPPSPRMGRDASTRRDVSPHSGVRVSGKFPPEPPQICRDNKPGRISGHNSTPVRGPQCSTTDRPGAQSWKPQVDIQDPPLWVKPPALPPPSASVNRSNSSARPPPSRFDQRREQNPPEASKNNTFPLQNKSLSPRPGLPGPPSHQGHSLPPSITSAASLPHRPTTGKAEQRGSFTGSERNSCCPPQELDSRWYVGKVTRGQAEGCLRQVRKDGAYLVRDSTRQLDNQPFTLMVFYQDKVYNIQIRQQKQQFLLGTGLMVQEFFPSVSDIISHYSQSPLLLINAKDRSSSQQNQCLLSDPAGFFMTRQNWS